MIICRNCVASMWLKRLPHGFSILTHGIVKLRLRLRLRLTQALRHSGQTQAQWLRLSDRDSEPGLTLKSCRPPPTTHPTTFKHEGAVPHKNPKSKTDLEWSPQPIQHKKFQVDNDREYMEQSHTKTQRVKLT